MVQPVLYSALLILSVLCGSTIAADQGQITQASRNVFLEEPDVILYTNNMSFKPGKLDKHGDRYLFEYAVAADYSDTLIALEAITQDTKEKLTVTEVEGPLRSNVLDTVSYNSTDFIWF